MMYSEF